MEDRVRRPPTYLPLTPKIFDRAYLEPIWKFQRERYSDLHLNAGGAGSTALDFAEDELLEMAKLVEDVDDEVDEVDEDEAKRVLAVNAKFTAVAKLLRGMMVLPKDGKLAGEKKNATKGGK